jgi:HB1, ASXL, restriction endonuclease HTH domain
MGSEQERLVNNASFLGFTAETQEKHMKSIHDIVREKETQITTLKREIEVLRAAAKIVGRDSRRSGLQRHTGAMSQPKMIREVLLKHGGPLHADQIAKAIERRFKIKLKRADLTSVIYRAIRGRKLFRREGVNTFGLVEWPARHTGRSKR